MAIVVQKYGGSSVADVEKINKVADKVVATSLAGNQVVVVVSAMGKTTDSLLALAQQVSQSGSPPRRELDMLVTTGERVSMALLSIAIQARGQEAISFTGSQCGIMTNDRHFNARIIEVRPHRVEDALASGKIVIVAGYQGVSYKREITTLGRGGSDTTAVALAAALNAERCEIYSDVDGVYSADPKVVTEASHIGEMDAALVQEMAECGAKVLNAQAVEWARRAGIAIYARASFGPTTTSGEPERQTIIRKFAPEEENRARAIVGESNAARISLEESSPLDALDFCDSLSAIGIPVRDFALIGNRVSFIVPLSNVPGWNQTRIHMEKHALWNRAKVDTGVAVVSVVGDGLTDNGDFLRDMVRALYDATCKPLELRASPLRLSAVVAADRAVDAQRALHRVFVQGP